MAHKKNSKAKARQAKAPAVRKPTKHAAPSRRPAAAATASKVAKKPAAAKSSASTAKSAPLVKSAKKPAPSAKPAPTKSAAKAAQSQSKAVSAKLAAAVKPPVAAKPATAQPVAAPRTVAAKPAQVKTPAAKAPAAKAPVAAPPAAQPARAVPAAVARPAAQRITQPVAPAPVTAKAVAEKTAAARDLAAQSKKPVSQRHGFKTNEYIVYPAHGVGRIVGIEEQEIAGMALELFVITFDKEKLTLRVPTGKLTSVGMRKLADNDIVKKAMDILKGRARIKRTMWSRRAQEYVAKINSGDLVSIAEVVRDLYRSEAQPEQSYSERQLYEDALDRMAREIAAVDKLDERGAVQRITDVLAKSAKGRRLAAEEAEAEADAEAEAEVKAA